MCRKLFITCSFIVSAMIAACTPNHHVDSGSIAVENRNIKAVVIFSASDREKIIHYFTSGNKEKTLPPGLAKKQELPRGLQKHIEKYGELPPGLEGRRLPVDLERTLDRLPEGYVRLKVGGDVVLMNQKTKVVVDVVWDVE